MASTEHTYALGGPGSATIWTKVANAATAVAKILRVTNQTSMTSDGSRIWTVTPENEEDSAAFYTFLDTAMPVGTSTGTEAARNREDGSAIGGGSAGGVEYVMGVAGPIGNKGADDVRKLSLFNGSVDATSGSSTQQALNPTKPTFVFKSVATSANTTVSHTLINAMTAANGTTLLYNRAVGNETILAGRSHLITYVTKAP